MTDLSSHYLRDCLITWFVNCSTEYGLTEASTGISVGSQPPLVIPTTQPGDTSPYQPIVNSVNVPLMRTQSAPSSAASPHSTKKRLSVISSETGSSLDSSSSSGVCDLSLHTTDEEATIRGSGATPLDEKPPKSTGRRNRGRKISRDESVAKTLKEIPPLEHVNSKEKNTEESCSPSKGKLCEERSVPETSSGNKEGKDKCTTPEEEKKGNSFFRTFSLRDKFSERDRSKSVEDSAVESVVTRRSTKEKNFNTVPRRRSFIERISFRSQVDIGPINTQRRRSVDWSIAEGVFGTNADEGKPTTPPGSGHSTEVRFICVCFLVVVFEICFVKIFYFD